MKKESFQDERVVIQRQKVQSEGFLIVFFILFISASVQSFVLNAPVEQYAVEMICFLGMSAYLLIRNIAFGNNLFDDNNNESAKVKPLVYSLVVGVITTAIHGVLNYLSNSEYYENNIGLYIAGLVVFFISITVFIFAVMSFMLYINNKNQARIQKQLDRKEQDE